MTTCEDDLSPEFAAKFWKEVLLFLKIAEFPLKRGRIFIYLLKKVHMKETKQMTLQLERKVHDSNTCLTLKHKNRPTLKNKNTNIQKHE